MTFTSQLDYLGGLLFFAVRIHCQQMTVGETIHVSSPSKFAYGIHGLPPIVRRDTDLEFELKLLRFQRPTGAEKRKEAEAKAKAAAAARGRIAQEEISEVDAMLALGDGLFDDNNNFN